MDVMSPIILPSVKTVLVVLCIARESTVGQISSILLDPVLHELEVSIGYIPCYASFADIKLKIVL